MLFFSPGFLVYTLDILKKEKENKDKVWDFKKLINLSQFISMIVFLKKRPDTWVLEGLGLHTHTFYNTFCLFRLLKI